MKMEDGTENWVRWDDMPFCGRNQLLERYLLNEDSIHPDDRARAITEAWYMAEFPASMYPISEWEFLFLQHGFTVDGEPAKVEDHFGQTVTIYRGCIKDKLESLSWTIDIKRAEWFAKRFVDGAEVYELTIDSSYIMAKINARREDEVLIELSAAIEDGVFTPKVVTTMAVE